MKTRRGAKREIEAEAVSSKCTASIKKKSKLKENVEVYNNTNTSPNLDSNKMELSSDSSSDEFVRVGQIDLDSEFFKIKKLETDFSAIESKILSGVSHLSDSEESEQEEGAGLGLDVSLLPDLWFSQSNIANSKQHEESVSKTKPVSKSKTSKTRPNKRARSSLKKHSASLNKTNSESMDVSQLLALGEGPSNMNVPNYKEPLVNGIKNSPHSSDDEVSDWEDVETSQPLNPTIPKEGVQVTLKLPNMFQNRKKRGFDWEAHVKRRINRVKRDIQVLIHKVHLLCLLAHGLYINSILNSNTLMGLSLSLLPSDDCYPPKHADISYLEKFVLWFTKTISINKKPVVSTNNSPLIKLLEEQFEKKAANSIFEGVLMFVCILRTLGLKVRLVMSFQPLPLKPPGDELCSINTKEKNGKVKDKAIKQEDVKVKDKDVKQKYGKVDDKDVKQEVGKVKEKAVKQEDRTVKAKTAFKTLKQEKCKLMSKSLKKEIDCKQNIKKSTKADLKFKYPKDVNFDPKELKTVDLPKEIQPESPKKDVTSNQRRPRLASSKSSGSSPLVSKESSEIVKISSKIKDKNKTVGKNEKLTSRSSDMTKLAKNTNMPINQESQISVRLDLLEKTKTKFTETIVPKQVQGHSPRRLRERKQIDTKSEDTSVNNSSKDIILSKNYNLITKTTVSPKIDESVRKNMFSKITSKVETNKSIKETRKQLGINSDILSPTRAHTSRAKVNGISIRGQVSSKYFEGTNMTEDDSDFEPESPKKRSVHSGKRRSSAHLIDNDFEPSTALGKKSRSTSKGKLSSGKRRELQNDPVDGGEAAHRKLGNDCWAEVFVEEEEKWICVDISRGKIHCVSELYSRATHPVTYVVAFNVDQTVRDVTRRYCSQYHIVTRKQRVAADWWEHSLRPWRGSWTTMDKEEEEDLEQQLHDRPLPSSLSEYKNHPLYVLRKDLLKFEAIYPPDAPTLGFIRGQEVFARECVKNLHSRETWVKEAKVVRLGEKPYKIVKARPKYDRMTGTVIKDLPLEVFGEWQVEDYIPPPAVDGKVPRNAYGNVELFKPCMLPKGTVHLQSVSSAFDNKNHIEN
uniref:Uncharacterized protein n=1 Tax=Timema shepardi TaxID=629360 RepID=A0A7R9AVV4_TIMSH|nr:unnamed protein product [Timema shepardi]